MYRSNVDPGWYTTQLYDGLDAYGWPAKNLSTYGTDLLGYNVWTTALSRLLIKVIR